MSGLSRQKLRHRRDPLLRSRAWSSAAALEADTSVPFFDNKRELSAPPP